MTGTLMSDEPTIDFITAPVYERDPKPSAGMFDGPDKTMIPALHGFTRAGNSTLCQLVEGRCPDNSLNFPLRQSIASRTFRVLSVLEGMHVDGIEAKCLDLAKFSFAGLSDFFPSAFIEEWKTEQIVVTIPREPREIQDFSLCSSKLRITIRTFPELTRGRRISLDSANPLSQSRRDFPNRNRWIATAVWRGALRICFPCSQAARWRSRRCSCTVARSPGTSSQSDQDHLAASTDA